MIVIIGAGIAGPFLGYMLQKQGMEVLVLEADGSLAMRHQGGMLNLNDGTGKPALKAAGLYETVMAQVLEGADALLIRGQDGDVLFADPGDGTRPEISRGALRSTVVEALPSDLVRWNSKVTAIEPRGKGFDIVLSDGSVLAADAIVGADGTWSKVRPLLTEVRPVYSGITFYELRYTQASRAYPHVKELVGDGTMFALAHDMGVLAHREPDDELCVYAALARPEGLARKPVTHSQLRGCFSDWAPSFGRMLSNSEGPVVPRPIYALPTNAFWHHDRAMTLIGDAAHVMSPFAGEGVNLALADAADLAEAIISQPKDLRAAFATYEAQMRARTVPFQEESAHNMALAFAEDSPAGLLAFFRSMGGGD